MTAIPRPEPALVAKLVLANRILYDHGIVDGLGHVSVRHDSAEDVFLLSCTRVPGVVTAADIVSYDVTGDARRSKNPRVDAGPRGFGRA
jgi:HCOMODA/2-hydroxy-3-carboxy-muconic semialdehyde decarboxylase